MINWDSFFWGGLAILIVIETVKLTLDLIQKRRDK